MRSTKYLLPIVMLATSLTSTCVFAQLENIRDAARGQESSFERRHDETDTKALREFVQSKENIEIKEKATELEISGDVRFEWRHLNEEGKRFFAVDDTFLEEFVALRGNNAIDNRLVPISRNDLDVEFNLKFKYTYKRAWAAAHLQFDNPAGIRGFNDCEAAAGILQANSRSASFTKPYSVSPSLSPSVGFYSSSSYTTNDISSSDITSAGSPVSSHDGVRVIFIDRNTRYTCKGSGEASFINLKRAYLGYNVYADGKHRFDIEIGRRKLNDLFDSEIQFSSRFDGIAFKYASVLDEKASWFADLALFSIDERVNHFGYAFEVGVLDIFGTGLDLKYSFIDWTKRGGKNRCFIKHPLGSQFRNSQFTFSYDILPEIWCKKVPIEFYGAFVINHAAKKTTFTHYKRKNLGFYLGVLFGEVNKEGDWSFDITYEYVQAQMASDCDVDGVGRGNILDERLTDILIFPGASKFVIPRRGNANFKGFSFEFIYALTDNLSLDVQYEFTRAEDSRIGGRHRYSSVEAEAIYAF